MLNNLFARTKKTETHKPKSVLKTALQDAVCILALPALAFTCVALNENDPLPSFRSAPVRLTPSGVKKGIVQKAKGVCGDPQTPQTTFLANCVAPTNDRESREAFAEKVATAIRVEAVRAALGSNAVVSKGQQLHR